MFRWKKMIAFLRRDFQTAVSYKFAFVMEIISVIFALFLWYFISKIANPESISDLGQGRNYFEFAVVGLAGLFFIYTSLRSFSDKIRQEQLFGTLEAMIVTPTGLRTIVFSSVLWDFVKAFFRIFCYLFFGWLLLDLPVQPLGLFTMLVVIVMTCLSLSGLGIFAAGVIMVLKRGNPITFLMGIGVGIFGGGLFPVQVLPPLIQWIAYIFPPYYALSTLRRAVLYGDSVFALAPQLGVLALFTLIFLPTGLLFFRWAVERARMEGSLVQY